MFRSDKAIRKGSNSIQSQKKEGFTTMTMENHTSTGSKEVKSLTLSHKLITGIIAIALMCVAPIIPILIAFGAGHFLHWNSNKLNKEKNNERRNSRRY